MLGDKRVIALSKPSTDSEEIIFFVDKRYQEPERTFKRKLLFTVSISQASDERWTLKVMALNGRCFSADVKKIRVLFGGRREPNLRPFFSTIVFCDIF